MKVVSLKRLEPLYPFATLANAKTRKPVMKAYGEGQRKQNSRVGRRKRQNEINQSCPELVVITLSFVIHLVLHPFILFFSVFVIMDLGPPASLSLTTAQL